HRHRNAAIDGDPFAFAEFDLAHVELEQAGRLVGAIAENAGGIGVLADFTGDEPDSAGYRAERVQGYAKASDGVDPGFRFHRVSGLTEDGDARPRTREIKSLSVQFFGQLILPYGV